MKKLIAVLSIVGLGLVSGCNYHNPPSTSSDKNTVTFSIYTKPGQTVKFIMTMDMTDTDPQHHFYYPPTGKMMPVHIERTAPIDLPFPFTGNTGPVSFRGTVLFGPDQTLGVKIFDNGILVDDSGLVHNNAGKIIVLYTTSGRH